MLVELYPRRHVRFSSLRLLGPHVDGFIGWLQDQGYPRLPIRLRIRETPRVDARLRMRGIRRLEDLSRAELLALAPRDSQTDIYLAAVVRSLAQYLDDRGLLAAPTETQQQKLVATYRVHLDQVRGLVETTQVHHVSTAFELLTFLGYDEDPRALKRLKPRQIESFIKKVAPRVCRESLQHTVAHLRSFLRFLVGRGVIADGLDDAIDTPRVYRGERLPRSLSWKTVQSFLAAIDPSAPPPGPRTLSPPAEEQHRSSSQTFPAS